MTGKGSVYGVGIESGLGYAPIQLLIYYILLIHLISVIPTISGFDLARSMLERDSSYYFTMF